MGAFWANAESLFETARQAAQSGSPDCDWAILIAPGGAVHVLDATGWALPSLLIHHGAETAYRVTREDGRVSLEGRRGSETCILRSESPAAVAQHLLYHLPVTTEAWHPPAPALLGQACSHTPQKETWTTSS